MHRFTSHRKNTRRYFLHLNLPENPACWLFGHKPGARIADFRSAGKHVFIECRVCDRRYIGDRDTLRRAVDHLSPAEAREKVREIEAARVVNAERDPVEFARGQVENTRQGFDGRTMELSLELSRRKKWFGEFGPGVKLHVGGRGSETPFDGHVDIGKYAAYWSVGGIGGRLAEWLGRGHKRDLSLSINHGALWWKLWYDDDGGHDAYHRCDSWRQPKVWPWSAGRHKHRGWMCLRDGNNIELNPLDALWGRRKWLRDETFDSQTVRALVPVGDFDGDEYEVEFTLERRTVRREHGPAWAQRVTRVDYSAEANARPGIPVRNHSWKGDDILGWHVGVTEESVKAGAWVSEAVAGTVDLVRRDRKRYNYATPTVQP